MSIVIQTSDLDHARIDGTRVYLKELLKRFGSLAPEREFFLYHKKSFNPALAPSRYPNYIERTIPFSYAWMQTRFAWEMFTARPEKLFLPIQAAPFFLPQGVDCIATIHDLAFKKFPETFPRHHLWKLNFMLDTVVRQADRLIAVSESTKRDLLDFYPTLDPKNITVIHHGFDAEFFGQRLVEREISTALSPWSLERNGYVLYVGALQPRKNLIRLIQAFERVKKEIPEMKLVLAGEPAWLAGSIVATREASPYRDDIILTGRVDFNTLRALYQGARLFAFPSLYEGFGLPILEAFASQVPVLTADNSSLREVSGNGAIFVDARDIDDISNKLKDIWQSDSLRTELVKNGTRELTRFSWDKTARETMKIILQS